MSLEKRTKASLIVFIDSDDSRSASTSSSNPTKRTTRSAALAESRKVLTDRRPNESPNSTTSKHHPSAQSADHRSFHLHAQRQTRSMTKRMQKATYDEQNIHPNMRAGLVFDESIRPLRYSRKTPAYVKALIPRNELRSLLDETFGFASQPKKQNHTGNASEDQSPNPKESFALSESSNYSPWTKDNASTEACISISGSSSLDEGSSNLQKPDSEAEISLEEAPVIHDFMEENQDDSSQQREPHQCEDHDCVPLGHSLTMSIEDLLESHDDTEIMRAIHILTTLMCTKYSIPEPLMGVLFRIALQHPKAEVVFRAVQFIREYQSFHRPGLCRRSWIDARSHLPQNWRAVQLPAWGGRGRKRYFDEEDPELKSIYSFQEMIHHTIWLLDESLGLLSKNSRHVGATQLLIYLHGIISEQSRYNGNYHFLIDSICSIGGGFKAYQITTQIIEIMCTSLDHNLSLALEELIKQISNRMRARKLEYQKHCHFTITSLTLPRIQHLLQNNRDPDVRVFLINAGLNIHEESIYLQPGYGIRQFALWINNLDVPSFPNQVGLCIMMIYFASLTILSEDNTPSEEDVFESQYFAKTWSAVVPHDEWRTELLSRIKMIVNIIQGNV